MSIAHRVTNGLKNIVTDPRCQRICGKFLLDCAHEILSYYVRSGNTKAAIAIDVVERQRIQP